MTIVGIKKNIIYTKAGIVLTFLISLIICNFFVSAIDVWYVFGSISVASILIPFIGALWNQNLHYPSLIILVPALLTTTLFNKWHFFSLSFNQNIFRNSMCRKNYPRAFRGIFKVFYKYHTFRF